MSKGGKLAIHGSTGPPLANEVVVDNVACYEFRPRLFFLEIRFDDPQHPSKVVDEEMKEKVLTADCPYGSVTVQFDSSSDLPFFLPRLFLLLRQIAATVHHGEDEHAVGLQAVHHAIALRDDLA